MLRTTPTTIGLPSDRRSALTGGSRTRRLDIVDADPLAALLVGSQVSDPQTTEAG